MVQTSSTQGTNTRIKVVNNQSKYYADLAADSATSAANSATSAADSATEALNYKNATYGYKQATEAAVATISGSGILSSIDEINTVANSIGSVNTVAGSITNVNKVGADIANVNSVAGDLTNIDAVKNNKTNIDTVAGDITNVNSVAGDLTNIDTCVENLAAINAAPTYATNAYNSAAEAQGYAESVLTGGQIWYAFYIANWVYDSTTDKYKYAVNSIKAPVVVGVYQGNWYNKKLVEVDMQTINGQTYLISPNAFDGLILASLTLLNGDVEDTVATEQAAIALNAANTATSAATTAQDWAVKTSGTVDSTNYSAKYYAQEAASSASTASSAASSAAVTTVVNNLTAINAVATSISDVNDVADNLTNIAGVNSNETNINAVNSNKTNIDTVAGSISNINAVALDLTNINNASSYANLAEDWATKMNGTVDGNEYSAKYYAQQAASGQINSNWTESDTTSKAYILNKPTSLSSFTDDLGTSPTHTHSQYLTSHQSLSGVVPTSRTINSIPLTSDIALTPSDIGAASSSHTHSELDNKTIISLSGSGTVSLSLNRIHKVTQTGDITFSLPNGSSTDFCQMQVMIEANGSSITLGTANYFNGKVPSFSANTCYSLIYEYDVINSGWTVGFMSHS